MRGTVVKLLGKVCSVRADAPAGHEYECHLRGRIFDKSIVQIAVGDRVDFDPVEEIPMPGEEVKRTGVIHQILPRETVLTRPARKRGGEPQVIAANLDQVVVVSALKSPAYRTGLMDRYLVIADRSGIAPALCLNKIDLAAARELDRARKDLAPYAALGVPLVFTSAVTGEGLGDLETVLRDKRSVLAGHSGVGKSRLAARLQPGLTLASGGVTRAGKGRHTTSASTLFSLDFGGELVDTPGIRELGISDIDRDELDRHFPEFRPYLGSCRFPSCSHIPEPGCAVKEAVEKERIPRARYESYEHLYHELHELG